jgi:hypothetical protein
MGVACSVDDELVVADWELRAAVAFSAGGAMLKTMPGGFSGVVVRGGTVFAQEYYDQKCVVFT